MRRKQVLALLLAVAMTAKRAPLRLLLRPYMEHFLGL